ncbi:MAG: glycosyltransferase family A protein [Sulfobacillus sp.]
MEKHLDFFLEEVPYRGWATLRLHDCFAGWRHTLTCLVLEWFVEQNAARPTATICLPGAGILSLETAKELLACPRLLKMLPREVPHDRIPHLNQDAAAVAAAALFIDLSDRLPRFRQRNFREMAESQGFSVLEVESLLHEGIPFEEFLFPDTEPDPEFLRRTYPRDFAGLSDEQVKLRFRGCCAGFWHCQKFAPKFGIPNFVVPNANALKIVRTLLRCRLKLDVSRQLQKMSLFPSANALAAPVYVLTRSSNRPREFARCRRSVASQTVATKHFVSYDTAETLAYLLPYDGIRLFSLELPKMHPNLYPEVMLSAVPPDNWVMFLDDDDVFVHDRALEFATLFLHDTGALVYWKLWRPDKEICPKDPRAPAFGEVGSCCYLFWRGIQQPTGWQPKRGGDYPFFARLKETRKMLFLDHCLTAVGYEDRVSGWKIDTD